MAGAAERIGSGPVAPLSYFIPEDTLSSKIASFIPIIGCFISGSAKMNLSEKIEELFPAGQQNCSRADIAKAIELRKVSKDYQIADLGRDVLSLALIVSLAAFGVFGGFLPVLLGGLFAISVVFDAIAVEKNHRAIDALKNLL